MSAPAAIRGTFADFKLIRGRKVVQLVIEVPIEQADEATRALGGLPRPDAERWVAVALLAPEAARQTSEEHAAPRRRMADLPLPQQVALRCQDKGFVGFVADRFRCAPKMVDDAVRNYCGVKSRAEILPDTSHAIMWKRLDDEYMARQYEAYA